MPVLATIATVSILFSRNKGGKASFLDPAALRARIEGKLPEGAARNQALAIVDDVDTLALRYDDATAAALSVYVEDVKNRDTSANDLIGDLTPLDLSRAQALYELIRLRMRLLEVLTPAQWSKVFG